MLSEIPPRKAWGVFWDTGQPNRILARCQKTNILLIWEEVVLLVWVCHNFYREQLVLSSTGNLGFQQSLFAAKFSVGIFLYACFLWKSLIRNTSASPRPCPVRFHYSQYGSLAHSSITRRGGLPLPPERDGLDVRSCSVSSSSNPTSFDSSGFSVGCRTCSRSWLW